jgi:hypothetical protein
MDPTLILGGYATSIFLLVLVVGLRGELEKQGSFHRYSYQLGLMTAIAIAVAATTVISTLLWLFGG